MSYLKSNLQIFLLMIPTALSILKKLRVKGYESVKGQWMYVCRKFTLEINFWHFTKPCVTSILSCNISFAPKSHNFGEFTQNWKGNAIKKFSTQNHEFRQMVKMWNRNHNCSIHAKKSHWYSQISILWSFWYLKSQH